MEDFDLKRFVNITPLYSKGIKLRRIMRTDIDDVYEYASDPATSEYLLWQPHTSRDFTKKYLEYIDKKYKKAEFFDWGIEYENKMIGTCGFTCFSVSNNSAEIGYVLNKRYWGRGIAAACAKIVMEYGFTELKLERIEARYMIENDASRRVMEKCMMKPEGVLRHFIYAKKKYRDIGVYSILADEYFDFKVKGLL